MFSCRYVFSQLTGPKCIFLCVGGPWNYFEVKRGGCALLILGKFQNQHFNDLQARCCTIFSLISTTSSSLQWCPFLRDFIGKNVVKNMPFGKGRYIKQGVLLQIRVRLGKWILGKQIDTLDRKRHSREGEQLGFLFRCASLTPYILRSKCIKWTLRVRQRPKYFISKSTESISTKFGGKNTGIWLYYIFRKLNFYGTFWIRNSIRN
jgi:hypothetical protein